MITKKDKHTPLIHLFLGYPEPILLLFFWVFFFFAVLTSLAFRSPTTHTHTEKPSCHSAFARGWFYGWQSF